MYLFILFLEHDAIVPEEIPDDGHDNPDDRVQLVVHARSRERVKQHQPHRHRDPGDEVKLEHLQHELPNGREPVSPAEKGVQNEPHDDGDLDADRMRDILLQHGTHPEGFHQRDDGRILRQRHEYAVDGVLHQVREPRGVVLEDAPESPEGVLESDLLALFVRSPIIRDTHLEDAHALRSRQLADLRRHLRLYPEALLLQFELIEHALLDDLVACLHVGEVKIGEHVGKQREHLIAQHMPEVQHSVRLAAHEARPVHHVRLPINDRLEQFGILIGIVLHVRILDEDHVACRLTEARLKRGALAGVFLVVENLYVLILDPREDVAGTVGRAVVNDDDLALLDLLRERGFFYDVEDCEEGVLLVEDGYYDG